MCTRMWDHLTVSILRIYIEIIHLQELFRYLICSWMKALWLFALDLNQG